MIFDDFRSDILKTNTTYTLRAEQMFKSKKQSTFEHVCPPCSHGCTFVLIVLKPPKNFVQKSFRKTEHLISFLNLLFCSFSCNVVFLYQRLVVLQTFLLFYVCSFFCMFFFCFSDCHTFGLFGCLALFLSSIKLRSYG